MSRDLPNIGPTHFPHIPAESWRDDAACAGEDARLFDDRLERESDEAQEARHGKATSICRRCPVRLKCGQDIDIELDDGVRGGHVLPPLGARSKKNASHRDRELVRLLQSGWPLELAAPAVARIPRGNQKKKAS